MRYVRRTNDKFIACQSITALFEVITSKRQQSIVLPEKREAFLDRDRIDLLRRRPCSARSQANLPSMYFIAYDAVAIADGG
jgi:hypothetical protein